MHREGHNQYYCLGDVLGRGQEQRVFELLSTHSVSCLLGNHEVDLRHHYDLRLEVVKEVETWPYRRREGATLFCHTWLQGEPPVFQNIDSTFSAQEMFASDEFQLAFVGHSHSPGYWKLEPERPRWTHAKVGTELVLGDGRYIVDVGSLGEPQNDDSPRFVSWSHPIISWHDL